jgi:hypothetical protein
LLKHESRLPEKFVCPIRRRPAGLASSDLHLFIESPKATTTVLAIDPRSQKVHPDLHQPTADRAMLMVVNVSEHDAPFGV